MTGSRLLTSVEVHIIAIYLHVNCAEYGLQKKRFNPLQSIAVKRKTSRRSVIIPVNMTHCKWWNSCIGFRHIT